MIRATWQNLVPATDVWQIALAVLLLLLALAILWHLSLWLLARRAGLEVGLMEVFAIGLRTRRPGLVLRRCLKARRAGIDLSPDQIEIHQLAGGRVGPTLDGVTAAAQDRLDLSWELACELDLAGTNVARLVEARQLGREHGLDLSWTALREMDRVGLDPLAGIRIARDHRVAAEHCTPGHLLELARQAGATGGSPGP